jgi:DNA invertase Pin-like site-specific DNA recombinase
MKRWLCALYARVSTRDKGQDVENQLAQLRQFAATQGWEIVVEYVDRESGSTGDRVQFQRMFDDASRRQWDVCLFWSLDRFSREGVLPTLQYLNRLESYGVCYRSFTEPYFDSCGMFKDAIVAIMATLAKQERLRLSQRVVAGLERARRNGKRLGRPRRAFRSDLVDKMRAQGVAWRAIADELGVGVATLYRQQKHVPKTLPRDQAQA